MDQEDVKRYSRQLALPGFNDQTQHSLFDARVLIVGCGGLGNPVLMYLTAAGIGTIGIADHDIIQMDNLHRQVLFTEQDIGRFKAEIAVERLRQQQHKTKFTAYIEKINVENAQALITQYDIVVDCTDNFEVRFVLDDACGVARKPLVFGALYKFEGQVSVLHHQTGTRYRDICPTPPPEGRIPNCETGGVLGTLAGTVGCIQANEVIKIITGIGAILDGKLLLINLADNTTHQIHIQKRQLPESAVSTPIQNENANSIREIEVYELKQWMDKLEDFQLIDVREPEEYEQYNLGGTLMPMNSIANYLDAISRTKKVVIHCKAGLRSAYVIQYLQKIHGFKNLFNLRGGTQEWIKHN